MFKYTRSAVHYTYRGIKNIYSTLSYLFFFLALFYDGYAIFRDKDNLLFLILNSLALVFLVLIFVLKQVYKKKENETSLEKYSRRRKYVIKRRLLKVSSYSIQLATITLGLIEILIKNINGIHLAITVISIVFFFIKIIIDIIYEITIHYLDVLKVGIDKDMQPISIFSKVRRSDLKAESIAREYSSPSYKDIILEKLEKENERMEEEKERNRKIDEEIIQKNKEFIKSINKKYNKR